MAAPTGQKSQQNFIYNCLDSVMEEALSTTKMKLFHVKENIFVWNAADARQLREEWRVVGTLVGCLPRLPRQNVHLGLPLQLLPEEITLLLDEGLAEVVEKNVQKPTDDDIIHARQLRKDSHEKQVELFRNERREDIHRHLPEIIAGKKAKRDKLLEERRRAGETVDDAEFEEEIEFGVDDVPIPSVREDQVYIQLNLETAKGTCAPSCHRPVVWTYPNSDHDKLRYTVFRDLWKKGFYLTSAMKFGGDFLAYPGDPSRFHSMYIVVCRPHHQGLTALDVVAMGRLATNVKKTVLLCSTDNAGEVCYTSLQWTGIS